MGECGVVLRTTYSRCSFLLELSEIVYKENIHVMNIPRKWQG
jgi:hypothetical protein